jgi:transposase
MAAVSVGENSQWHSRFVAVFSADTFIDLLKQLLRYYDGTKIHMIEDYVMYRKSPKVHEWLVGNENLIEAYFLPPYSPKLNAVECIGKIARRESRTTSTSPNWRIQEKRWHDDSTHFKATRRLCKP